MRNVLGLGAVLSLLVFGVPVGAQDLVEEVARGCEKELKTYCAEVTPGQGRGLACLYAFSDKLSPRCEYALYDAAVQLERAIAALTYVANECDEDLAKHCAEVEVGEGRVVECLKKNKISKRCSSALSDVGIQ